MTGWMHKRMKGFFGKSGWMLAAWLLAISGNVAGAQKHAAQQDGDVKKAPEKAKAVKHAEKDRDASASKEKIRLEKKKREWASGSQ